MTTTQADVSATAFYTSTQRLTMPRGVVSLTFFVTIHDNFVLNTHEKQFQLVLTDPSDGAVIGNQGHQRYTFIKTYLIGHPYPYRISLCLFMMLIMRIILYSHASFDDN